MGSNGRKYAVRQHASHLTGAGLRILASIAFASALLLLCSCTSSSESVDPAEPISCITPFASFDDSAAESANGISIDTSHTSEGYIGIKGENPARLKIKLSSERARTYELDNAGVACFYPFHDGDGSYELTVYYNTSGDRYVAISTTRIDVRMSNEYQPWLHANYYVNFNEGSQVVSQAADLTADCGTDAEKVSAIYDYLTENVKYDYDLAASVADGYVPDPDKSLMTKKGICFDYASTSAAMIRSLGIPCKLVTGYVSPDDQYHAWNMVYLQDRGWVEANIDVSTKDWNRIDVTFAAAGEDSSFVGDGENYTTRFEY